MRRPSALLLGLLATILVARIDHVLTEPLTCYSCNSIQDGNCAEKPEATEVCGSGSTTVSPSTTTVAPSSTEPTTSTTTEKPSTASSTTTTSTEKPTTTSSTTTTTTEKPTTTSSTTTTTTEKPTTTSSTTTTTTEKPTTTSSTTTTTTEKPAASSSTTTTTTEKPAASSPSTEKPALSSPSTEKPALSSPSTEKPQPPVSGGTDEGKQDRRRRFARAIFPRADEPEYVCVKISGKVGEVTIVQRGCSPKSANICENLPNVNGTPISDVTCNTCEGDKCNSSSTISLGLMSMLLPLAMMIFFAK